MTTIAIEKEATDFYKPTLIGALIIFGLNIMDTISTITVLGMGGYEANPLSALLIEWHIMWPLKILIPAMAAFKIWKHKLNSIFMNNLVWFVAGFYACVIMVNAITFAKYAGA